MGLGLSGPEVALIRNPYPDFGQIFYMVDSDYRTAAQGWSRADRTGPLDLHEARKSSAGSGQYVYRTSDYSSDSVAIQAAVNNQVDYRGDTLFFTPGDYSVATALTLDVPDSRWLGRQNRYPTTASATITAAVAAALAVSADRMEFAFLRFVPLTTSHIVAVSDGADFQHWHDFFYDSDGIAADTGTQLMLAAGTMDDSCFEDFVFHTDAAAGPLIELDGTVQALVIRRFLHFHQAGTLACSLLDVDGAGTTGVRIHDGQGQIGGGGAVTSLFEHADMTSNATNISVSRFYGSVGYAAAATLTPAASAAAEADYADSYLATIGGGAGGALYIGTA